MGVYPVEQVEGKIGEGGMKMQKLVSPFPYFGGKSSVANKIWSAFGQVDNYIEPFFGSGAVLLSRPGWLPGLRRTETVNDADGLLANFWRSLQADPDGVARHADWPVNENDLEARHLWLVNKRREITAGLNAPEYFDAKAAGWWVWGCACWIGSGWCSGKGPWIWDVNKHIVNSRQLPHLGGDGRGVNRQRPHLGGDGHGQGVNRKRPHLGGDGQALRDYLGTLASRLRWVRVCSGDWSRIMGPTVTVGHGITGVFLDPPYSTEAGRGMDCYAIDCGKVAHKVRAWCEEWGRDNRMRICLAGYAGEGHGDLRKIGWREMRWKASGGYENQSQSEDGPSMNCTRERLWFSPACQDNEPGLFDVEES